MTRHFDPLLLKLRLRGGDESQMERENSKFLVKYYIW